MLKIIQIIALVEQNKPPFKLYCQIIVNGRVEFSLQLLLPP